ncbi:MAG: RNA ligase (ATP) [Ktedonobacterales bacterium]|nr:RNA ligase (ATP) [Ktedonobacterales bacterium]
MSTFAVKVRRVTVMPHPNADLLELGTVDDYHVVIAKGAFVTGDLAVYIPEQAIVPANLITAMDLVGKLAGADKNRVRAIKLRGELSQGLLYRPDPWPAAWVEGTEVSTELAITKWEPPIPLAMAGDVARAPFGTIFRTYTDIENVKTFPHVLQDGEEVVMTEKLHGTCFVSGLLNGESVVSSKGIAGNSLILRESANNVYWRAAHQEGIFEKLAAYLAATNQTQAMLFGEVLGVQDLKYGFVNGSLGFRAFDLYTADGFAEYDDFVAFCTTYAVPQVPLLYRGPFSRAVMLAHTVGQSTLATHLREGVVIRPIHERDELDIGRVILKSVSGEYLTRKNATETQ